MARLQFKAVLLGAFVSIILLNTARGDRFLSTGSLHGGIKRLEGIVEEEFRNGEVQKKDFYQKKENGDDRKEEGEGIEDMTRKRRETGDLGKKKTNKKDYKVEREGKKEKKKKKTGARNVSIKEKEKKKKNAEDVKRNKLVGKKHTNRNLKKKNNNAKKNKLGKKHELKSDSKKKKTKKSKKENGRNSGDDKNRKRKKPTHKNLKNKKKKTKKNKERKVKQNPKKGKQVKEDKRSKLDDKSGKKHKRRKSSRRRFSKNKSPKYEIEDGKKKKNRAGRGKKESEEGEESKESGEEVEEGTVLYERGRSHKKRKPQQQKLFRMSGGQIATSIQCGETFTLGYGESAILLSINDGRKAKCDQIFQSPLGTTISLDCPQFNLNLNGCRREKMFVLPGTGGKKKSKFCDVDWPSLTTPSNSLEIRYRRRKVKRKECSGGYVCMASVNGERPTTLNEGPVTPAFTTPVPTTPPPTTPAPTTLAPTTPAPKTPAPTTLAPTTLAPTTLAPTTLSPTTLAPTTLAPTTLAPTTPAPTPAPTTSAPTTPATPAPTTPAPTTPAPTTLAPTTLAPTSPATTTPAPTTTVSTATPNPTTKPPTAPASTRLYCDTCGTATITVPRIVGGEEATISEYPWQVIIRVNAAGFTSPIQCGGSIIKKSWILTAAHCFIDPDTYEEFASISITVTVREHDLDQTTEVTSIDFPQATLFVHPQYKQDVNNRASEEHDIALLRLGSEIPFETGILPICMATSQDFQADQEAVVAGWGLTTFNGNVANQLQEVTLKTLNYSECVTLNNNAPQSYFISENMICAIAPGKDSCQGDSGGPLVTQAADGKWVQLGIVSFGYQCAVPNVPGFYTNVANYTDWITETTQSAQC